FTPSGSLGSSAMSSPCSHCAATPRVYARRVFATPWPVRRCRAARLAASRTSWCLGPLRSPAIAACGSSSKSLVEVSREFSNVLAYGRHRGHGRDRGRLRRGVLGLERTVGRDRTRIRGGPAGAEHPVRHLARRRCRGRPRRAETRRRAVRGAGGGERVAHPRIAVGPRRRALGLFQGAGAELGFALFRYRRFDLIAAALAAALAAVGAWLHD